MGFNKKKPKFITQKTDSVYCGVYLFETLFWECLNRILYCILLRCVVHFRDVFGFLYRNFKNSELDDLNSHEEYLMRKLHYWINSSLMELLGNRVRWSNVRNYKKARNIWSFMSPQAKKILVLLWKCCQYSTITHLYSCTLFNTYKNVYRCRKFAIKYGHWI